MLHVKERMYTFFSQGPAQSHWGSYNEWPPTSQLDSVNLLSYRSGGQKWKMGVTWLWSRCWQSWFLLEAVGENPFPCLFQHLEATHLLSLWRLPSWSKPGGMSPAHRKSSLLWLAPKPRHHSQFQIQNSHFPATCPACDRTPHGIWASACSSEWYFCCKTSRIHSKLNKQKL